jgi:hypothetical protein
MKSLSFFMNFVMLAIFGVLVLVALNYSAQARFMPLVAGIPAIGLLLLQIVIDIRTARKGKTSEAPAAPATPGMPVQTILTPRETIRREMILWGYFLGLIVGILFFGFWISIPIFLVSFLRFEAKCGWAFSLILGIGATAILYLAFVKGLTVELHNGFIVDYIMDNYFPE